MGTVNHPDVTIQFYDEGTPDWIDITQYCKTFTIRDAGILKIPQATVLMRPPANFPEKYERFRIFVDSTGTDYMPFYGRISELTRNPQLGTTSKRYHDLVAYGLEKELKNDTITWKYASEQAAHGALWTYKTMIEDFLVLPDTGYDTNLTLDTDAGNILNDVAKGCDFSRDSLLDALRLISETIDYDGYVWIDGATAKLKYVGLGTLAADPATTFADPFVRKPELNESIDEVFNYILPWGGVEVGYPTTPDVFTERAQAKYIPDIWEALTGETIVDTPSDPADLKNVNSVTSATASTLTDTSKSWTVDQWVKYSVYIVSGKGARQFREILSNTATQLTVTKNWTTTPDNTSKYQVFTGHNPYTTDEVSHLQLSRYCIRLTKAGTNNYYFRFRIDRTGVASIDLEKRYFSIDFWIYINQSAQAYKGLELQLTDTSDNVIGLSSPTNVSRFPIHANGWRSVSAPTLSEVEISDTSTQTDWRYQVGSSFNKNAVKYLDIIVQRGDTPITSVRIDKLLFSGGLKIHPFQNPQYYPNYASTQSPASQDATSISNYGVRLYHHDDRDINNFVQAQDEADRVLAVLKDPFKTVTVVKKGFEWLRPNQTVTLNSSTLGISSETWRTVELAWDWVANYPVYCAARLVPQNNKTPPVFAPSGEVPSRGVIQPFWVFSAGKLGQRKYGTF